MSDHVAGPVPHSATPGFTQTEAARVRNRQAWRSTAIGCLLLLVTVIAAPLIPVLLVITLIENGQRENAALNGTYTPAHQRHRKLVVIAAGGLLCGTWLLYWNLVGSSDGPALGGVGVGVLLLLAGAGMLTFLYRQSQG